MRFEEVGERFGLVDAHHDGVQGQQVHQLEVTLDALHTRLGELVQSSEQ